MIQEKVVECDGCGVEVFDGDGNWNCPHCDAPVCLHCSGEHKEQCEGGK